MPPSNARFRQRPDGLAHLDGGRHTIRRRHTPERSVLEREGLG